ncbi:MAG: zinc ribbon domain-containing protein [Melioribacteraceae bacterium]|nr:zinc ribbon domain-containing protein [Melioribacteraceae bacterium]
MPTYDYRCKDCGHTAEVFQKMTDDHLSECPKCSGNFKRLIGSGSDPIFKGTGFYETDYKKSKSDSQKKSA